MEIAIKFSVWDGDDCRFIYVPASEDLLQLNITDNVEETAKKLVVLVLKRRSFNKPVSELGWLIQNGKIIPPVLSDDFVREETEKYIKRKIAFISVVEIKVEVPDEYLSYTA